MSSRAYCFFCKKRKILDYMDILKINILNTNFYTKKLEKKIYICSDCLKRVDFTYIPYSKCKDNNIYFNWKKMY